MAKKFFERYDTSALDAAKPRCDHFSRCGGCRFQDVAYEGQLRMKQEYLQSLFDRPVAVMPAEDTYGYRNRMDFVYHDGRLCLRKRGAFNAMVPIDTCQLVPNSFQDSFDNVQELLKQYAFQEYDVESHEGFLRYIVFRYAHTTNQLMLIVTTTTPEDDGPLRSFLNDLSGFAHSVQWFVNDTWTDVSIPEGEPEVVLGEGWIEEELAGVRLRYGAQSFFQSNVFMAERAFTAMRPWVSGNTVDLGCGVGAITLAMAERASSIIGIELVEEAVGYARENARLNGSDVRFFTSEMRYVKEFAPMEVDTMILDPPRPGAGKKTMKRIMEVSPKRIVYLSCNPQTQRIDLDWLAELGGDYRVVEHVAFDFFPHTPHVESLIVLER